MRGLLFAVATACVGAPAFAQDLGPLPFPVERGSALPPPAVASTRAPPPEGEGSGGLEFGQWRQVSAEYGVAFQARVRERYAGQEADAVRTNLEANGFVCQDGQRLDCRIEIVESGCAFDWYVVIERNRRDPIAGFDRVCLSGGRNN
ncbi:MAG: hypothetical protein K2P58_15290 [Hyphomonadaceae bacterium]|nr:hypothetical protein [Hyphomonadaceae bacterium]